MNAERCKGSGTRQSVDWDAWGAAYDANARKRCTVCGNPVKYRVRGTDLPPWARVLPHRVDGTPTR